MVNPRSRAFVSRRLRTALVRGDRYHPVQAWHGWAQIGPSSVHVRRLSDFGDTKPDAATDLSTKTNRKKDDSSQKEPSPELDPSKFTVRIEVKMPGMGTGGGKILKWYKNPGDVVKREEVLCDIETRDFTFGMEVDDENIAIMGEILVEAPSGNVKDDEVICTLLHEEPREKKTAAKQEE